MRTLPLGRGAVTALLAAVAFSAAASPAAAQLTYVGQNNAGAIDRGDVTADQFYSDMAAIGENLLREDVYWPQVEGSQGRYDWHVLDRDFGLAYTDANGPHPAAAHNVIADHVPVLLVPWGTPEWARDLGWQAECLAWESAHKGTNDYRCPVAPAAMHIADWQRFVVAAVEHFRGEGVDVAGVEVWNEPNLSGFWYPQDPNRWAQLVIATGQAVEGMAEPPPLISGGVSASATGMAQTGVEFLQSAFSDQPTMGPYLDGIGLHPYALCDPSDTAYCPFETYVQGVRAVRSTYAPAATIWITETGMADNGDPVKRQEIAQWLPEQYDILDGASDVPTMVLHTLYDATTGATDDESTFGMEYHDATGFHPKPVYTAFRDKLVPPL